MTETGPGRREQLFLVAAALLASMAAIAWSWTHNAFLLYGDAEAHIHIARRLFDSHRPGLTQLGSVWLPLPHLLIAPFVAIDPLWRSGIGPAIPSALCYLLGCLGLYRLMRKWLSPATACLGLAFFAANPNLLYLQTTAMTESLFLCELIWSVLLLVEWYASLKSRDRRTDRLLWIVIAVLVAAVYTRYDGWILACFAWVAMAICLYRRRQLLRKNFILASLVLALAPASWMLYNAVVFQDWLDFLRGPYSAKAIEARSTASVIDLHPGWHDPLVAIRYFTQAADLDAACRGWGFMVMTLALFGSLLLWLEHSRKLAAGDDALITHPSDYSRFWPLLLWLPLPFYTYSVSYGSVPIFIPTLTPFSWYNTRYGMELLPALAFFSAFTVEAYRLRVFKPKFRWILVSVMAVIILANLAQMLREHPLTLVEAQKNTAARGYYNAVIPAALARLHQLDPHGIVLMNTSNYPSFVTHSGLTYAQTINESDKEFYWAALGAPAAHASFVLAFAGDEIDKAVHAHPEHLVVYQRFHSPNQGWDQADVTLYTTDTFPIAAPNPPSTPVPTR